MHALPRQAKYSLASPAHSVPCSWALSVLGQPFRNLSLLIKQNGSEPVDPAGLGGLELFLLRACPLAVATGLASREWKLFTLYTESEQKRHSNRLLPPHRTMFRTFDFLRRGENTVYLGRGCRAWLPVEMHCQTVVPFFKTFHCRIEPHLNQPCPNNNSWFLKEEDRSSKKNGGGASFLGLKQQHPF